MNLKGLEDDAKHVIEMGKAGDLVGAGSYLGYNLVQQCEAQDLFLF